MVPFECKGVFGCCWRAGGCVWEATEGLGYSQIYRTALGSRLSFCSGDFFFFKVALKLVVTFLFAAFGFDLSF